MKTDLKPIEIYAIARERWKDTNTTETEIDLWVNGYLECQAANRAPNKSEVLKTDDQIREEALKLFPVDLVQIYCEFEGETEIDMNENERAIWIDGSRWGVESAQSTMEAEIDRRANEKLEEFKESLRKKLRVEIIMRSGPQAADCGSQQRNHDVRQAYKHCIDLLKPSEGENHE